MEIEKVTIELDFNKIHDVSDMHLMIKKEFGFPDFYGNNINSLIDCWGSMRFPEEGMSELVLEPDEYIVLMLHSFSKTNMIIINNLLIAIEEINNREKNRGRAAMIKLSLY
ncbi:barstar family protein [Mariniflexile ostreae]|uniref:Barstar family protein n=1 Tax=Mariniflexile ostreae TaxID=1520892 RepID=A0ABV5FB32_9FLAO